MKRVEYFSYKNVKLYKFVKRKGNSKFRKKMYVIILNVKPADVYNMFV